MILGLGARPVAIALAIAASLGAAVSEEVARADPSSPPTLSPGVATDIAITSFAAGAWIFTEAAQPWIGPTVCGWCDRDPSGADTLNGFDAAIRSALRWSNPQAADITSGVFAFGVAPAGAIASVVAAAVHDHRGREAAEDLLFVAEATSIAMDVNQIVKFAEARARPDIHDNPFVIGGSRDERVSFFSGHTTFTFALAASSGTVASMRGYRLAPMVWAGGMVVAATTGYLRIAADKHYATDVIVGGLVGTAIGAGVPLLLHHSTSRIVVTGSFDAHTAAVGLAGVL